jgi:hypothetical protein
LSSRVEHEAKRNAESRDLSAEIILGMTWLL